MFDSDLGLVLKILIRIGLKKRFLVKLELETKEEAFQSPTPLNV